jgi:hypothetical protein
VYTVVVVPPARSTAVEVSGVDGPGVALARGVGLPSFSEGAAATTSSNGGRKRSRALARFMVRSFLVFPG